MKKSTEVIYEQETMTELLESERKLVIKKDERKL